MLCIVYNEQKEKLKWKFGGCPQDLRKWAKENMELGDHAKFLNPIGENTSMTKVRLPFYKYFSLGSKNA